MKATATPRRLIEVHKTEVPVDRPRESYLAMFHDGVLVKVLTEPDPRPAIVASFERINEEFTAQPISAATASRLRKLLRKGVSA